MSSFAVGDFVWAKASMFPYWPGQIIEEPENSEEGRVNLNSKWVSFFGQNTQEFRLISDEFIKPFIEHKTAFQKPKKSSVAFKRALNEIELRMSKSLAGSSVKAAANPNNKKRNRKPVESPPSLRLVPSSGSFDRGFDHAGKLVADFNSVDSEDENLPRSSQAVVNRDSRKRAALRELNDSTFADVPFNRSATKKIGLLGTCVCFNDIVCSDLVKSGHEFYVFSASKTPQCLKMQDGMNSKSSAIQVVLNSDIIISNISDPAAANETFALLSKFSELTPDAAAGKDFVQMATSKEENSKEVEINKKRIDSLIKLGFRYLETAELQTSQGKMIFLTAGDEKLFDDCQPIFKALNRQSFYVGAVGNAAKMKSILLSFAGAQIAGTAESFELASNLGIPANGFMEVFPLIISASKLMEETGRAIAQNRFSYSSPATKETLDNLQATIRLADTLNVPMPIAASANNFFKTGKKTESLSANNRAE